MEFEESVRLMLLVSLAFGVSVFLAGQFVQNKEKTNETVDAIVDYDWTPGMDPLYVRLIRVNGTECVVVNVFRGVGVSCNWRGD